MSETVHYKGKLIHQPKNSPTDTLEEQCKRILNGDKEDYCDSFAEQLRYTYNKEYVIRDDELYKVVDFRDVDAEEEFFNAKKLNGKDFEFDVMYYNGGCGFEEAIDEALKGIK